MEHAGKAGTPGSKGPKVKGQRGQRAQPRATRQTKRLGRAGPIPPRPRVTPATHAGKTAFLERVCGDRPEALVELGVVLNTEDAYDLLDNASDTSEKPSHPHLLLPTDKPIRFGDQPTPPRMVWSSGTDTASRPSNPFRDILIPPQETLGSASPNERRRSHGLSGASKGPETSSAVTIGPQPAIDNLKQVSKDIQDSLDRMIAKNTQELARPHSTT